MFGTIAILKPKSGQESTVVEMMERWWDERSPAVPGVRASHVYRNVSNPEELMLAVVFDSREQYEANAQDPEQDRWFQQVAELLDGEPRWIDGDVLSSHVRA